MIPQRPNFPPQYAATRRYPAVETLEWKPSVVAGSNLLLYGLGYVLLRRYWRFLVALVVLIVLGFFLGNLGVVCAYMLVIGDTVQLARKIQDGKDRFHPRVAWLDVVIVFCAIGITLFSLTPKYLLAFSEESCDFFYRVELSLDVGSTVDGMIENTDCKRKVLTGDTWFTFGPSTTFGDKGCERGGNVLRDICYFNKAWVSENPGYCQRTSVFAACIENLAWFLDDRTLCEESSQQLNCEKVFDRCSQNTDDRLVSCEVDPLFSCDGLGEEIDAELRIDCMRKFGIA